MHKLSEHHTAQPPGQSLCQDAGEESPTTTRIQEEQCGLLSVDQLLTLKRLPDRSWKFASLIYMYLTDWRRPMTGSLEGFCEGYSGNMGF